MTKSILVLKIGEPLLSSSSRLTRALYLANISTEILPSIFLTSSFDHHLEKSLYSANSNPSYRFSIKKVFQLPYSKNHYLSRLASSHLVVLSFFLFLFAQRNHIKVIICAFPTPELSAFSALFSWIFNIRFVLDVRDMWPEVLFSLSRRNPSTIHNILFAYYKFLRTISLSLSDLVLTGSPFYARYLSLTGSPKLVIFPVMNISIPSSDVTASRYKSSPQPIAQGCEAPLRLVFCGTLGNSNVIKPLLEELSAINSESSTSYFHITFYGGGENYDLYRSFESSVFSFKGWASQTPLLLSQYDLALLPYHPVEWYSEFFGNKYFECLDARLPVLISHGDGLAYQIIQKYTLGLSYQHSPSRLFALLVSLYYDREKLQHLHASLQRFYPLFLRYRRLKEYQLKSRLSSLVGN